MFKEIRKLKIKRESIKIIDLHIHSNCLGVCIEIIKQAVKLGIELQIMIIAEYMNQLKII